jgi:hypothetical protein
MWGNLSPDKADIGAVYAPLAQKAAEFGRAWSAAELQLSEDDLDWLGCWFAALPADATLAEGNRRRNSLPREKLAALMIVLGAERCRRFASEGYIWRVLRRLIVRDHPMMSELFLSNGQPSDLTKHAIEEAVHTLGLRSALDVEGTEQWFMTIKLQFGFTHKGAKRRLAEWLVGLGTPHAVQYLSGQSGPAELTSRSFQSSWTTLRQYRRELISDEQAREVLQASPWVKSDWIDELLAEARAHIATLGRGDEYEDVGQRIPVATPEDRGPLEAIALSWPIGGIPRISFRLDREAITEECRNAQCAELDFYVDGRRTRRWLLQSDGTWDGPESVYAEPEQELPRVNLAPKTMAVRSRSGEMVQHWDLADLGLQGDVQVFDLDDGRLVEFGENRLDPGGHYALVCDRGYTLAGCEPLQTCEPQDSSRKAIRLPSPLTTSLRLSFEDFTIWQPVAPQEEGRERITATLTTPGDDVVTVGGHSRLVVKGLPADASDVRLLIGKRPEQVVRLEEGWATAREVAISPEIAAKQKVVRIRCQLGEHVATIVPALALRLRGAALITSDARHPEAEQKLTLLGAGDSVSRSADGAELRAWVSDAVTSARVFEGHCYVGPLRHGRVALKDFPGLGGRLTIRGTEVHTFDSACVDSGCFRESALFGIRGTAHVGFRVKFKPEPDYHRFVAWLPADGGRVRLETLPRDVLPDARERRDWRVPVSDSVLALALTWRGTWLGACWRSDKLLACSFEPSTQFFAAIRWLRLPILHPDLVAWLEPIVQARPPFPFLEAWLENRGLPDGLCRLQHEPAHDTVVRQFVGHWRPQQDAHYNQAVLKLSGVEPRTREGLLKAVDRVSRYSLPLLWWVALRLGREGRGLLRQAVATFLGLDADQPDRTVTDRLDYRRRLTREYCACSEDDIEGLTSAVLAWLAHPTATLPARSRDDLLLALGSESGRRYFAASVLLRAAERQERTR